MAPAASINEVSFAFAYQKTMSLCVLCWVTDNPGPWYFCIGSFLDSSDHFFLEQPHDHHLQDRLAIVLQRILLMLPLTVPLIISR